MLRLHLQANSATEIYLTNSQSAIRQFNEQVPVLASVNTHTIGNRTCSARNGEMLLPIIANAGQVLLGILISVKRPMANASSSVGAG